MIGSLLGAIFFGSAAYVGALLGMAAVNRTERLPDAPPQAPAPVWVLVAASAVIGAIAATHATQGKILLIAIVCVALVAIWISDARTGIVPDAFTLGPLGLILFIGFWQHAWPVFISAAIPFVPFALTAALSKGRGMGWGDVKLVALGGAVLGAQSAVLAFALACVAAVALNYLRGRRSGAIAFAPYLAAAIGIGIPVGLLR